MARLWPHGLIRASHSGQTARIVTSHDVQQRKREADAGAAENSPARKGETASVGGLSVVFHDGAWLLMLEKFALDDATHEAAHSIGGAA